MHPEAAPDPKAHLRVSGHILGCHDRGRCCWHLVERGVWSTQDSPPPNRELSTPDVSSPAVKTPRFRLTGLLLKFLASWSFTP